MEYQRIYDSLISFRKKNELTTGYYERHHILPRSLGGKDDDENLVKLTAREHFIAHLLLARFNRCKETAYAIWMMQCSSKTHKRHPIKRNSRTYEWCRIEFAKYQVGKLVSEETRKKQSDYWTGRPRPKVNRKPHSEETKQKMRIAAANRKPVTKETREKLSKLFRGRKIKPCSDEHKKKISLSLIGKKRKPFTEEHKQKIGNANRKTNKHNK